MEHTITVDHLMNLVIEDERQRNIPFYRINHLRELLRMNGYRSELCMVDFKHYNSQNPGIIDVNSTFINILDLSNIRSKNVDKKLTELWSQTGRPIFLQSYIHGLCRVIDKVSSGDVRDKLIVGCNLLGKINSGIDIANLSEYENSIYDDISICSQYSTLDQRERINLDNGIVRKFLNSKTAISIYVASKSYVDNLLFSPLEYSKIYFKLEMSVGLLKSLGNKLERRETVYQTSNKNTDFLI